MLNTSRRTAYGPDHEQFRDTVRRFLDRESTPNLDRWEREGEVETGFWRKCGDAGLLCPTAPEALGGLGLDYLYNAVIVEEHAYNGCPAHITLQSDITLEYFLQYASEEIRRRYVPRMISGEIVTAIAMTEPGAGSDLQGIRTTARRDGDDWIIDGSKTYISNGQTANLVIVVARTDPDKGAKGISLLLVEAGDEGFARGRNLDKIGLNGADTSELFFSAVRVPGTALLGAEGQGFRYLMSQLPQERLSIAIASQAAAQRAFDLAVAFCRERRVFGEPLLALQNTKFVLGEMAAKLQMGWAHIDWCLTRHVAGELTAQEASAAKLLHTELQWECCDASLQLHGGAGYMNEYPIARLWRDSRVSRIFGGTTEIMKEVLGRAL